MNPIKELGAKLDAINNESLYNLLSRIFIQYENHLFNSHMELFAAAIEDVRKDVQRYMKSGYLPDGTMHINGLKDYNTGDPFYFLDSLGTQADRLREAIGFSEEEIRALKEMLIIVTKTRLAIMKRDIGVVEA
jgi:hypothetical protein